MRHLLTFILLLVAGGITSCTTADSTTQQQPLDNALAERYASYLRSDDFVANAMHLTDGRIAPIVDPKLIDLWERKRDLKGIEFHQSLVEDHSETLASGLYKQHLSAWALRRLLAQPEASPEWHQALLKYTTILAEQGTNEPALMAQACSALVRTGYKEQATEIAAIALPRMVSATPYTNEALLATSLGPSQRLTFHSMPEVRAHVVSEIGAVNEPLYQAHMEKRMEERQAAQAELERLITH